jgi:choline monooxygenase
MFVNNTRLPHALRPEHYKSAEWHNSEIRCLFQPAWHPICAVDALAKAGDFLSFDLLETPILLRNFDGEIRAFLNVCAHRHARLTCLSYGNTETLRCQYHGWQYDVDGRAYNIPEARAFRPWDHENSCLKRFRIEKCGNLLFVNLSDTAPPLREWLGPLWDRWCSEFSDRYKYAWTWQQDFPCNWKVVVENSLESYHIPLVHPKTFGEFPVEENVWHELGSNFTTFKTIIPNLWINKLQARLVRALGGDPTMEYWHHNQHPHITFNSQDVYRLIMCVFPLSPTSCRYRSILFTLRGTRSGPIGFALSRFLRPIVIRGAKNIFDEDGSIYPAIQLGLSASTHRGVIGRREERIYHFQRYVLNETHPVS